MKEYYSIAQVAKLAGVTRMTVYNWIKRGKIKAVKVGRAYAIPARSVKNYIVDIEGKPLTESEKKKIERSVNRTIKEYGDVLKWLGNE